MKNTFLPTFLSLGEANGVRIGSRESDIVTHCGTPESVGERSIMPKGSDVWGYAKTSIQFGLYHGEVSFIAIYCVNRSEIRLPELFGGGSLEIHDGTSPDEYVALLNHYGINFEQRNDERGAGLILSSTGVLAVFDTEEHYMEKLILDPTFSFPTLNTSLSV